jgi:hypothetical protein
MLSSSLADSQRAGNRRCFAGFMTTAAQRLAPRPSSRLGRPSIPSPRSAPFTYAIVGLLLITWAILRIDGGDVDTIVGWASTNVHNLTRHPIAATVASAFVVPSGLLPELIIVAISFAVVERAVGTLRVIVIALAGHIGATLVTEGAVGFAIVGGLLPTADLTRPDVGISYAMFAVLAAATLVLRGRLRIVAIATVVAVAGIAAFASPDMTAAGHLLSVAIGLATMLYLRRTQPVQRDARTEHLHEVN